MDHRLRSQELTARYLEGLAGEDELAELQSSIVHDEAVADAFAEAIRIDAALFEFFKPRPNWGAKHVRSIKTRTRL